MFIRATIIRDDKVLEGATSEKYKAIRDLQVDARRKDGTKTIPVLPEWKSKSTPADQGVNTTEPTAPAAEPTKAE